MAHWGALTWFGLMHHREAEFIAGGVIFCMQPPRGYIGGEKLAHISLNLRVDGREAYRLLPLPFGRWGSVESGNVLL
jgi:hypothetical protein